MATRLVQSVDPVGWRQPEVRVTMKGGRTFFFVRGLTDKCHLMAGSSKWPGYAAAHRAADTALPSRGVWDRQAELATAVAQACHALCAGAAS